MPCTIVDWAAIADSVSPTDTCGGVGALARQSPPAPTLPPAACGASGAGPVAPGPSLSASTLVLGECLGEGGNGRIFRCVWGTRTVAVKIVKGPARLSDDRRTMDQEVAILKRLADPKNTKGVVQLLAWRRLVDGRLFLFFDIYPISLRQWIGEQHSHGDVATLTQARHFASELCGALAYVHAHRVLHRDLKPANILLRVGSGYAGEAPLWSPVLCDFGNAAFLVTPHSMLSGKCHCTLWYAAPETLLPGTLYSWPSDVWSLGLVLAEIRGWRAVMSGSG